MNPRRARIAAGNHANTSTHEFAKYISSFSLQKLFGRDTDLSRES